MDAQGAGGRGGDTCGGSRADAAARELRHQVLLVDRTRKSAAIRSRGRSRPIVPATGAETTVGIASCSSTPTPRWRSRLPTRSPAAAGTAGTQPRRLKRSRSFAPVDRSTSSSWTSRSRAWTLYSSARGCARPAPALCLCYRHRRPRRARTGAVRRRRRLHRQAGVDHRARPPARGPSCAARAADTVTVVGDVHIDRATRTSPLPASPSGYAQGARPARRARRAHGAVVSRQRLLVDVWEHRLAGRRADDRRPRVDVRTKLGRPDAVQTVRGGPAPRRHRAAERHSSASTIRRSPGAGVNRGPCAGSSAGRAWIAGAPPSLPPVADRRLAAAAGRLDERGEAHRGRRGRTARPAAGRPPTAA